MPVDFKFNHVMVKVKKWILGGIGHHLNTVNPSTTDAVVQRCSVKNILKNVAKFTGKHLYQNLFLNKVAGLRPSAYYKRDSSTDVFQ